MAQLEVEPVVHAEVVDAVFLVDLGADGGVAACEGPRALDEQPARRRPNVLRLFVPSATSTVSATAVPAAVALGNLPALAQLHRVLRQVAVGHEGIIEGFAVAVAAQPAHFAEELAGELHDQVVIPVVDDLQPEVSFNQHGLALLLQVEFPLGEGDGEVGAMVVHLEEKKKPKTNVKTKQHQTWGKKNGVF